MEQKNKFSNHIPMMLVILMVLILMVPTIMTIIKNSKKNEVATEVSEAKEENYYLTWKEYKEANSIVNWNWNDAANAIEKIAVHAGDLYEAGDLKNAYEYAKATYWGYYETTVFERNTMTSISGARVSATELQFTNFRKSVKKDLGTDTVRAEGQKLVDMLKEDALILSPEGPVAKIGGSGENFYLTWKEYKEANEIQNWNWNDVAEAIEKIAVHAGDLYEAADSKNAYEFAKATYWGYYETTGFERNTMTSISGARVSATELQFTTFRKAVKKDLGQETIRAEGEKLISMLKEDALILSPEGPVANVASASETAAENKTSSGSRLAVFAGSFGIILREGLEAILVVGAIIAYLVKSGNKEGVRPVYIGAGLAIICSFALAGLLSYLKSINPETTMTQEIIEGIAALTAVVVLFYVSNWMVSKSESAAWSQYIEDKVAGSAEKGNMFALGFTAWLAVFREGAEVILFYQPMLSEGHPDMVWAGFIAGCLVLVVVFLLIRFLSIKLPLKPFFLATGILMSVMTVCFLGSGIKELMEGGVFDEYMSWMTTSPSWLSWIPYNDVLDVFGIYPLIGTIVPQLILIGIIVVTFIIETKRNKEIRVANQAAGNNSGASEVLNNNKASKEIADKNSKTGTVTIKQKKKKKGKS